ncbi:MAG: hypothetical protein EKK33_18255, partial [Bradyrhizobiaceae bacterium]
MPGHSRSKDGVASACLCPGIHAFLPCRQDVDGRDKPGHDAAEASGALMTYIAKPKFHHPGLKKNELGYTHRDYEG